MLDYLQDLHIKNSYFENTRKITPYLVREISLKKLTYYESSKYLRKLHV